MSFDNLPVPYVRVEGTPFERGLMHGQKCSDLIGLNVQLYKNICSVHRGITWDRLLTDVRRFTPAVKRYDGMLFEEIRGIAAGSGSSLEEILLLNVRSEVMHPIWMKASMTEGCTSFIAAPPATRNGLVFVAQTWDWIAPCAGMIILLHSRDAGGNQFVTISEAGMIGKVGCSDRRIGIVKNYLAGADINPQAAPYNFVLRRVLDAADATDAQRELLRSPFAFALSLLIGAGDGFAVNYELTAAGHDFMQPESGIVVHTNHFKSPKLSVRDVNKRLFPCSLPRLERAGSLLHAGPVDLGVIVDILSDHASGQNSICRHGDGSVAPELRVETIFTIIMELVHLKLYFTYGPCCSSDMQVIDLHELFNNGKLQHETIACRNAGGLRHGAGEYVSGSA